MKANDIEIKISTSFFGHEGETCYQGTVYARGKKVGAWSDDTWGGMRLVDLDNKKHGECNKRIKSFFEEAGLMEAPARKDAVSFEEESDFTEFDYLNSLIDFTIDEKKGFRSSPTAMAKRLSKDGMEGVAIIAVKYHIYDFKGEKPSFSRAIDSFVSIPYNPSMKGLDIAAAMKKEKDAAKRGGMSLFVIRKDGTAQSLKAFEEELRAE